MIYATKFRAGLTEELVDRVLRCHVASPIDYLGFGIDLKKLLLGFLEPFCTNVADDDLGTTSFHEELSGGAANA